MDTFDVHFHPQGKTVRARRGDNLMEVAREAFIEIDTSCSGKGTCGKCHVQLVAGESQEATDEDRRRLSAIELEDGVRLACRVTLNGTTTVRTVGESKRKSPILTTGVLPSFVFDPVVRKTFMELPKPTLHDNLDDFARLERALMRQIGRPSLSLLQGLATAVREGAYRVTLIQAGDRLIGVEPTDTTGRLFGVAVDIGTTTVVASLLDLLTGEERGSASMINPQKSYGLDVLTRIQSVKESPDRLGALSGLIREGIDELIGELCEAGAVKREEIYEVAVAANATMTQLFLGIDPRSIGAAPYQAAFTGALTVSASEVALSIAACGEVYLLPAVSSYIGADIVAGLIATEIGRTDETALLIDMGTNGEIALALDHQLHACSCAAGPALEGMNISCGMRASGGAIERIDIDGDVRLGVIGDRAPEGICGSGVIDAVGELVRVGGVMKSGRLLKPASDPTTTGWRARIRNGDGGARFVFGEAKQRGREIALTQKDIRQVQLAKGAILSGVIALASRFGKTWDDIDRVYVAGAFGHHVRLESLSRLGVMPKELIRKTVIIGNASKAGASLCLLSKAKRREAEEVARRVSYLELSCHPGYERLFSESLSFDEAP